MKMLQGKKIQVTALSIFCVIALTFLLYNGHMLSHLCPDCREGDVCSVCLQLNKVSDKLRQMGNAFAGIGWGSLLLACLMLCCLRMAELFLWKSSTPVKLKIRMDH